MFVVPFRKGARLPSRWRLVLQFEAQLAQLRQLVHEWHCQLPDHASKGAVQEEVQLRVLVSIQSRSALTLQLCSG